MRGAFRRTTVFKSSGGFVALGMEARDLSFNTLTKSRRPDGINIHENPLAIKITAEAVTQPSRPPTTLIPPIADKDLPIHFLALSYLLQSGTE
jgi:hypothetical protein